MRIRVNCYAGYRGEQTPRSLHFGASEVAVRRVVDCWIGPDHRYFKLEGEDGAVYIVRHDAETGGWELTLFDDRRPAG